MAVTMAGMIDPALFEHLKSRIEEDLKAREDLSQITQLLERDVAFAQGVLSRVHSTPRSQCESQVRRPMMFLITS